MNDDVISLYFSVEKQYRKHAVWMMNDSTALALRTLKDDDGNYIWNVIEETKTDAGKRKLPITEDVAMMFRAIIEDRKPVFREYVKLFL